MLCFAGENVSRKMDEEGLPRDGCKTRSARGGSCSDRPRSGTASSGVVIRNLNSQNLRSVSRKLRFHTVNFSDFEGHLARKLRFHIFNFHFMKEVSHESFDFTSSTSFFKASLARKLCFHIFNFQPGEILSKRSLHEDLADAMC